MLVNNAGIGMRTVNPRFMTEPQGFWETPVDGFRAVIDTNLTGYFLMAREVTPRLLAAGGGRIVNVSVSDSTMHRAGFSPYGPSRAGSEALSRVMAADLRGTGVTVNVLLPGGATVTGMIPDDVPSGGLTFLMPEVMGPPIVWLASDEAAGVHDERIVATEFDRWVRERSAARGVSVPGWVGARRPWAGLVPVVHRCAYVIVLVRCRGGGPSADHEGFYPGEGLFAHRLQKSFVIMARRRPGPRGYFWT